MAVNLNAIRQVLKGKSKLTVPEDWLEACVNWVQQENEVLHWSKMYRSTGQSQHDEFLLLFLSHVEYQTTNRLFLFFVA